MSGARLSLAPWLAILLMWPTAAAGEGTPEGRAVPDAVGRSTVELRSQPGVEVVWEGVTLGETDARGLLVIEGVPPGEYRLALRKSGFVTLDARVEAAAGTRSARSLLLKPVGSGRGAGAEPEERALEKRRGSRVIHPEPARVEPVQVSELSPPTGTAADSGSTVTTTGSAAGSAATRLAPAGVGGSSPDLETVSGSPFSPFLGAAALLLALLAGAVGARFLPRSRRAAVPSHPPPGRAFEDPPAGEPRALSPEDDEIVFEVADHDAPGFLEDLKQRERHLGEGLDTSPERRETIIEVEAVEIRPVDEA